MQLSITTTFPDVQRKLDTLQAEVAKKATARAVNRAIEQARTQMSREIRADYLLSAQEVASQLSVKKATFFKGRLSIEASLIGGRRDGRSLNLVRFVTKVTSLATARRRIAAGEGGRQALRNGGYSQKALQLDFKIKRRGPKQRIAGAFMGNKGRTVFIREPGAKRLPIKALRTIDVAQMFSTKRIKTLVTQTMRQKFPAIFEREVAFALTQFNRGRV
jgi:hypothetical protein